MRNARTTADVLVSRYAGAHQQQPGQGSPEYYDSPLWPLTIAPDARTEPIPTWPFGAQRTSANAVRGAAQVGTTRALRGRAAR
jgi:hypothetical protein